MTGALFTADAFVARAESQLGVPYKWGGDSPEEGFDCSGLVFWSAATFGVAVPRTSQEQWLAFERIDEPRRGDCVFFDVPTDGPSQPGHVGIVLAPGLMLDAPSTGHVVSVQSFPFAGGRVMGYGRPPFVSAPVPTALAPEATVITALFDGVQRHVYVVNAAGVVTHYWQQITGSDTGWHREELPTA